MRGTTTEHLSLISAMPISTAWYCEDCKSITSQPRCAYCASECVHPLQSLLDGLPKALQSYLVELDNEAANKD